MSVTGYKISKTKIDKENITPKLLQNYIKNINGQLTSVDENGDESQIQIDVGDLQLSNIPLWKSYTIQPAINNRARMMVHLRCILTMEICIYLHKQKY